MEATGTDLLPIDHRIFRRPDPSQATPGMFDDLDLPAEGLFDPLDKATLLVRAIGPDQLETREAAPQRSKQQSSAVVVLDVGLMHQHMQHQSIPVDEQLT